MREVTERLKLNNLHTDHVVIRLELKYSIGAKMVNLKCWVLGGKTAPFTMVRVFRVLKHVATVQVRVEPDPELTRLLGPVANPSHNQYIVERILSTNIIISASATCLLPSLSQCLLHATQQIPG
jgi:hypothetical protein